MEHGTGKRVLQAWLAFPLAAVVGFGGSVLVRTFLADGSDVRSRSGVSRPARDGRSDRHLPAARESGTERPVIPAGRIPTA
jgi:hypothetical protein